jgi:hypothetical protein
MAKKNRATTELHSYPHVFSHHSSKVARIILFLLVFNARELSGSVKSSSSPGKRAREDKGSMLDPRERGNLCFKKGKFAASVDYYTEVCASFLLFAAVPLLSFLFTAMGTVCKHMCE